MTVWVLRGSWRLWMMMKVRGCWRLWLGARLLALSVLGARLLVLEGVVVVTGLALL